MGNHGFSGLRNGVVHGKINARKGGERVTLEVLVSCMHQTDDALVRQAGLTGDVLVINQCDREGYEEYAAPGGRVRIFSTAGRGLTRSRNMAIAHARGDLCLLCDDDEAFVPDYDEKIRTAYTRLPQADVIIFKMADRPASFPDRVQRLRFPGTMKVSSWQISFRRQRLLDAGVRFDELLGAGTGNGAEEELKFLLDCEKAGLAIYYVPEEIASVAQKESTWFTGFDETFFENRGATTRYILGAPMAIVYGIYYVLRKRSLYEEKLTMSQALGAILRGIRENKIGRQAKQRKGQAD